MLFSAAKYERTYVYARSVYLSYVRLISKNASKPMNTRSPIHCAYLFLSFAVFYAIWMEMTNRSIVHLFSKLSLVFVLISSAVVRCPISSEITSRRTVATRAAIQCSIRRWLIDLNE